MDTKDLRAKTETQLKELLNEKLHEQFNLRMQKGTGQLMQSHLVKTVRREIAQLKTILREKQGEAA